MWGYPADGDPVVLLLASPPPTPHLLSRSEELLQRSALRQSFPDATWTSLLWKRTPVMSCDPLFSSLPLSSSLFPVDLYRRVDSRRICSCTITRILGGRKIKRGICLFLDTYLDAIFWQTRTRLISRISQLFWDAARTIILLGDESRGLY